MVDNNDESQYLLEVGGGHQFTPTPGAMDLGKNSNNQTVVQRYYSGLCRLCSLLVAGIALISVIVILLIPRINKGDEVQRYSSPSFKEIATQSLHSLNSNLISRPSADTLSTAHIPPRGPPHCEATVLLLRHCDDHGIYAKDDSDSGDKHCSHMGYERTDTLPSLFGHSRRWPSPQYLYALLPEQPRGINYRQIETLLPLAEQVDLPIHVVGEVNQVSDAFFSKLQERPNDMCDTVTVVAWKHAFIPMVAAYLGCGPNEGCPGSYPDDTFDQVWQLKFVYEPEEPEDEVEKLFAKKSKLIADDYGLLAMELAAAAEAQEDDNNMKSQDNDNDSEPSNGWAVYGSITAQRFDPLQMLGPNSEMDL
jgi:hypothetical protein